jgi:hypothetical protein
MQHYFEHNFQPYRSHIDADQHSLAIDSGLELLGSFFVVVESAVPASASR